MSDPGVGVSVFISYGVNYSSRAWPVVTIIGRAHNSRAENVYRIVVDNCSTVITVVDIVYTYRFARVAPDLIRPWPAYISNVIIYVGVIDNGGLVYHVNNTWAWHIIAVDIRVTDIGLRSANPIIIRYAIAAAE